MDAEARWQILRLHVEDQIPLAALARDSGVPVRTLASWLARYRKAGAAGLDTARRSDSGQRTTPPELVRLIEGLALSRPRPSVATLHRLVAQGAADVGTIAPSYSTVRRIVRGLDPAMITLALDGPTSYRDKHELVLRRRATRPNQVWQADHTMLDILIRGADDKPDRPWLTVILDDYSRAICGYMVFSGAPSAMNTALALRQAIWPKPDPSWAICGVPDVLHVDHGSDFISHHLEHATRDLHVRIIHSTVGRPQGRGKIERFFGTINTELLSTLPGHLAAGTEAVPTLRLPDLDDAVRSFISSYNTRTHREVKTSPHDAWIGDGWLPRLPDSLEALDGLLLTVPTSRIVQRDGVHFLGQRYLAPTLASFVGHPVTVRYDPRDVSEIRIFDHDTFICVAVDEDHPNLRPSLHDIDTARRARRPQLRAGINERIPRALPARDPDQSVPPTPRPKPKLRTYEEDHP